MKVGCLELRQRATLRTSFVGASGSAELAFPAFVLHGRFGIAAPASAPSMFTCSVAAHNLKLSVMKLPLSPLAACTGCLKGDVALNSLPMCAAPASLIKLASEGKLSSHERG
jgi:hypothetical protein